MIKVTITHAGNTIVIERSTISHPLDASAKARENRANQPTNDWQRLGAAVISGTFVPIERK